MMLTGCAQPPNFAPVKTVNQTVEPENGYVSKKSPIKPSNNSDSPQASAKTLLKEQQNTSAQQNPAINSSPYPNQYQNNPPQIHSTGQTVKQKTSPSLSSVNTKIIDRNLRLNKPTPSPYQVESRTKNKQADPDVDKNLPPKQQKIPTTDQQISDHSKKQPIPANANNIPLPKKPKQNAQLVDNNLLISKNNKEKTSIISIDNKKVLKLSFQWPIKGKISRNFVQTDNKGIDIAGKTGQTVQAAEAGKAVYCGQGLAGFGNLVIIKHNETYLSAYANNSKLYIKEGQRVDKGQTIGQVGLTGLKKASLHFEIRKNGKPINPLTLMPKH